jgi:hypothetical protein
MKAVEKRIADEKVLKMIRAFLAAGYMEQWQYHKTSYGKNIHTALVRRVKGVGASNISMAGPD